MKLFILSFIISFANASAAFDTDHPDATLTPGVADASVTEKIVCKKLYTKDARHVTSATKRLVFTRYGFKPAQYRPGDYEIDHFISLELGGKNTIENLWPQPFCKPKNNPEMSGCYGAREKDVVETNLHRRICKGEITLEQAQEIIRTDWVKEFKNIKGIK